MLRQKEGLRANGTLGYAVVRYVCAAVVAGLLTVGLCFSEGLAQGDPSVAKVSTTDSIRATHLVASKATMSVPLSAPASTTKPDSTPIAKSLAGTAGVSAASKSESALDSAQPAGSMTVFDILSFAIGIMSLMVTSFAAVYAYRAATRSDRLLKRLVVYPFRELDFEYSELLEVERELLMKVFSLVTSGQEVIISDISSERLRSVDIEIALHTLVERKWLVRQDECLGPNPDRVPYLTFCLGGDA